MYAPELFELERSDDAGFDLAAVGDAASKVRVRVRVRRGRSPGAAVAAERARLADDVLGLTDDGDRAHRVAGPMIGYREAQVAVFQATSGNTPQGPSTGFTAAVLAATDGRLTATVTVSATGRNDDYRRSALAAADVVLQGFRWGPRGPVRASLVLRPRRERALLASAAGRGPRLSAAAIGRRFGPTDAQLARVRAAVRAAGLEPLPVAPQRTSLPVRGPVAAVERAFGVRLLAAAGGRHRPDREPAVPPPLRGTVAAVAGSTRARSRGPRRFPPAGCAPIDARRVYGMEELERRGRLGAGETIAVLSLDTFLDSDVAEYDRLVGIDSGPVERVPVAGGARLGGGAEEVNLDLDVIRGLAPRAKLLNYEAPNREGAFADVMERIVADGRAKVVSISWGRCELTLSGAERAADEAAFRAAAAAGIAVFVASGDSGAYECERFDADDQRLSVSWPAASRHVVAVGGTTLRLGPDRRRLEEHGWESPLGNAGAGGGTAARRAAARVAGGGRRARPAQRALERPAPGPRRGGGGRLPHGLADGPDGEPRMVGGTSAAAPFWAAVAALTRESLREAGRPAPPSFARLLYDLAARPGSRAFHDVTEGGNRFHDAGPGWDFATGLGTPDVGRLISEAQNSGRLGSAICHFGGPECGPPTRLARPRALVSSKGLPEMNVRRIAICLAATALLGVAGCGDDDDEKDSAGTTTTATTATGEAQASAEGGTLKDVEPRSAKPNIAGGNAPIEEFSTNAANDAGNYWEQVFQNSQLPYARPAVEVATGTVETGCDQQFDSTQLPFYLCADPAGPSTRLPRRADARAGALGGRRRGRRVPRRLRHGARRQRPAQRQPDRQRRDGRRGVPAGRRVLHRRVDPQPQRPRAARGRRRRGGPRAGRPVRAGRRRRSRVRPQGGGLRLHQRQSRAASPSTAGPRASR